MKLTLTKESTLDQHPRDFYSVLGHRLRHFREGRGLRLRAIAKELKVSPSAVSYWETGCSAPKQENLHRLARFYGVTLDELVGGLDFD